MDQALIIRLTLVTVIISLLVSSLLVAFGGRPGPFARKTLASAERRRPH